MISICHLSHSCDSSVIAIFRSNSPATPAARRALARRRVHAFRWDRIACQICAADRCLQLHWRRRHQRWLPGHQQRAGAAQGPAAAAQAAAAASQLTWRLRSLLPTGRSAGRLQPVLQCLRRQEHVAGRRGAPPDWRRPRDRTRGRAPSAWAAAAASRPATAPQSGDS